MDDERSASESRHEVERERLRIAIRRTPLFQQQFPLSQYCGQIFRSIQTE